MTGEQFTTLYVTSPDLRQHIVSQAKRYSKRKELQEDFMQEACLRLSTCDHGLTTEYYKTQIYMAIRNAYLKEKRQQLDIIYGIDINPTV